MSDGESDRRHTPRRQLQARRGGIPADARPAFQLPRQLQTNTTLEVLELNGNVIDYEGVGALAEALTQNTSLRTRGLRWGGAGRGGAQERRGRRQRRGGRRGRQLLLRRDCGCGRVERRGGGII